MNALDVAYGVGALILSPVWARKARSGWTERLGHVLALGRKKPGKPRVVLHAVSVGEVNALRELVPMLRPHAEVVVATTTDTGLARAKALFEPGGPVLRYPLDFSSSVRRFMDAVDPDFVGLVELEVWPNFVAECVARSVPVGVINGRLSDRSIKGYRRIRRWIGPAFEALAFAAAQNEDYAARFREMGTPPERVSATGSMKWDTALVANDAPGSAELARALGIDRTKPLIVAGSTAEGEEALLHAACPDGVQLLCAPRKPERFDEAAAGLPGCVRRSERASGVGDAGASRFLLDTLGELRAAYALADVAVIGRSFGSLGGSDPIEPIGLGRATLIGPSHRNFESIVGTLRAAGAIRVVPADGLGMALRDLLADAAARAEMARHGRACIAAQRGATRRHADMILAAVAPSNTQSERRGA